MSEEEGDTEKFFIGFDFSTQQVRSPSFTSLKLTGSASSRIETVRYYGSDPYLP
jgi:hypothetical protein